MRALWRKYFAMPSEGYLSERVFMNRLTVHICAILLCLACIAYTAYALFSSELHTAIPGPTEYGTIETAVDRPPEEGEPL